jgi:uncharacterized protein
MTPEERNLVTELFERLASLETNPRDPAAERAIIEGLRQAPNAVYSLVQTVLVQDEALKRADAHIRELEEQEQQQQQQQNTSFLGGLRDQVLGRRDDTRAGSVPSVRPGSPGGGISSAWRNTGAPAQPAQPAQAFEPAPHAGGGSFLGTAAAAAAGVVGGSLLMSGIHSMMGGGQGHAGYGSGFGGQRDASPWDNSGGGGNLAREAGLDDMGHGSRPSGSEPSGGGGSSGLFGGGESDEQDPSGGGGEDDSDFTPDDDDNTAGFDGGGDE